MSLIAGRRAAATAFAALGLALGAAAQLIAVENVWSDKGVCERRRLVRYSFQGGRPAERDVILEREQRFFGHFGGHRLVILDSPSGLVAGRYVVTAFGGVIDIDTKKVVHDETLGELLDCNSERVLYRVENAYRESGVFAVDLRSGDVKRLEQPGIWALPGVRSPDRARSAEVGFDGTLKVQAPGGEPKILAHGLTASLSPLSSSFPQAPVCWLDAATLLTQTDNGALVTVDLEGKVRAFLEIGGLPDPISTPSLTRDVASRLIYTCGISYVIDVARRTAEPSPWRALGDGFDAEREPDKEHGHILREHGKEIGRRSCLPYQAVTAPGLLAVPFARPESLGYPHEIGVWSSTEMRWQSIAASVNCLVGWVTRKRR